MALITIHPSVLDDLSTSDGLDEPLLVIHRLILAIDSVFEDP